jgi:hypothetical protein
VANWAYLTVSDEPRIYPGFQNPSFDPDESWVLCSAGCVPLLWLPLFSEQNLVSMEFSDKDGPIPALAPVTTLADGLRRLDELSPFMSELFRENGGVAHHVGLFSQYMAAQRGRHVTIQIDEIECLHGEGAFRDTLRLALRGLDTRDPEVLDSLAQLSTVMLDRRFVTLADARAGTYAPEDAQNFFRILGEGYTRQAPWE